MSSQQKWEIKIWGSSYLSPSSLLVSVAAAKSANITLYILIERSW